MLFKMGLFLALLLLNYQIECKLKSNPVVEKLLDSLEIEDKCGQMTDFTIGAIGKIVPDPNKEIPIDYNKAVQYFKEIRFGCIEGSVDAYADIKGPNVALSKEAFFNIVTYLHNITRNVTKSKIPLLYATNSMHGASFIKESVLFPQNINMAATFNLDIAKKIAKITAIETRATGMNIDFSPVLDVGRQPLWPRFYETHGEDVYVGKKMAYAYITGHQGDNNNLTNRENMATTLKHFMGYSYPFNGRDRTPAYIPENMMREIFLPPFEYGVKAGATAVMIDSGEVNGIPGHANSYYINDILKGELDFQGFVISDWGDIENLYIRDKLAATEEDAVRIAVMAGVDMSIVPYDASFTNHCINLAKKDENFLNRVNDAASRILNVKHSIGLLDPNFDSIYPNFKDLSKIGTEESEAFNLQAARESIVLAKNQNNILPLDKLSNKKFLVCGPTGNLIKVLNGGWSYTWQGNEERAFEEFGRKKLTLFDAISQKAPNVVYMQGSNLTDITNLEETLAVARSSDYIILSIGEDCYAETVGNIDSIMLGASQLILASELFKLNKPVITVYFGGRPRIITDIVTSSNAVVLGMLPGNRGGEAVADILFNDYNPDGKLAFTYPLVTNAFITYDHQPSEDFEMNNSSSQILFPFGHGLSYTEFTYSGLILDKYVVNGSISDNSLRVSVTVTNTGKLEGKETVILYMNDEVASVTRPVRQVRGFDKVSLQPNQSQQVSFVLNTNEDLSFIGVNNKRVVEPGFFSLFISNLTTRFELVF